MLLVPPMPELADALFLGATLTLVALVFQELFESSDDEEWLVFWADSVVLLAIFQLRWITMMGLLGLG